MKQAEPFSQPIVEPYSFTKDKLPKTLSYPLKRSHLDAALRSASVYAGVYAVCYVLGRRNDSLILDAFYSPEQDTSFGAGRVLVRIWSVPRDQRYRTEQIFVGEGLPTLCGWLLKAQTEGNVWRGRAHHLTLSIRNGKLCLVEE